MSNTLFKKVTAAAAALSIVLSIVSPVVGVKAADASVDAANRLASLGVIVDNSADPSKYNLGSNITRREMLKVMMNLSSVEVTETCEGKFSDLPASDWGCKYAEAALKAGFIAANAKFRPNDMVTEAEALKMIMQARGVAKAEGVEPWSEAYRQAWVEAGILSADAKVSATAAAKRSMVIVSADSAVTNTTDAEGDDSDVNLDDLFGDLFDEEGDDMSGSGETSTGTTSTGTTSVKAGELEVTLSPMSPASATLPSSAEWVKVATFDISAGSSDVSVSALTLKRAGIGASSTISRVALFVNGTRASNDKTFNSTSDEATVYFTTPLVVKAGSTASVNVVGEMGSNGNNNEFTLQLVNITSSAAELNGNLPISANTMKVSSTAASALVLSNDGTVSDVKLGQTGVEIFKFKAKNNSSTSEDMTVSSVTLKEDGSIDETTELANVKLYADGTEVASVETLSSKYVTFNLSSPLFVKSGKTISFVVKADIVGGAGDYIRLYMDKDLDLSATGSKNGYIQVTNGIDSTTLSNTYDVDVLAGALSVVTVEPTVTELRKDKDDNVLGTFKITSNAGKGLELQKFKTTITEVASLATIDGVAGSSSSEDYALENVELYNPATQEIFDLDCTRSGKDAVCSSTSLNIALSNGSTTELQLRADTMNVDLAGYKFRASVSNIGTVSAADFYVVETSDDKQVTDITPSSITFKTLEVKTSGVTVNNLTMSLAKSAVIGSKDVSMLEFEVKADATSAVTMDELKVAGTVSDVKAVVATTTEAAAAAAQVSTVTLSNSKVGSVFTTTVNGTTYTYTATTTNDSTSATALAALIDAHAAVSAAAVGNVITVTAGAVNTAFTISATPKAGNTVWDKTRVTKVALYKDSISDANLIKSKSASDINTSGVVTFDSFKTIIAAGATQKFVVAVDFADDADQAYDTLNLSLYTMSLNDDENDDITTGTVNGAASTSLVANMSASADRVATIKGAGSLSTSVYTSESPLNNSQNLLGNTTSPVVAAFEVTALNEAIKIKDLHIAETSWSALKNGVKTVILLKSDKTTEIARKSVSSDDVFFDDVNYIVNEGTEKIYVKVETSKIGKDQAGYTTTGLTLKLQVTDAEGSSSSKVVTNPSDTLSSTAFNVVPVNVSAVTVAESREGSTLNDGASTVVAKVTLTADSTSNTKATDGATLKTKVEKLRFKVTSLSNLTAAWAGQFTIKRINPLDGTNNSVAATRVGWFGNVAANDIIEFDLTGAGFGTNDEISGSATYEVSTTQTVTTKTSNAYVELQFVPSTTAGQEPVLFGDDDVGTGLSAILLDTIRFGQLKYTGN